MPQIHPIPLHSCFLCHSIANIGLEIHFQAVKTQTFSNLEMIFINGHKKSANGQDTCYAYHTKIIEPTGKDVSLQKWFPTGYNLTPVFRDFCYHPSKWSVKLQYSCLIEFSFKAMDNLKNDDNDITLEFWVIHRSNFKKIHKVTKIIPYTDPSTTNKFFKLTFKEQIYIQ